MSSIISRPSPFSDPCVQALLMITISRRIQRFRLIVYTQNVETLPGKLYLEIPSELLKNVHMHACAFLCYYVHYNINDTM